MTAVALPDHDTLLAPMPARPLGELGWNASALTLGGVLWDTKHDDAGSVAVVHRALELGVNTFDTAFVYGNGESERKLGLALEGRRDRVWINTKVIDRTYDGAMRQMETSLERLRTDRVDLMFVHSVDSAEQSDQILAPNSVLKAIDEMRAAGRVRHVGVSGHWVKHVMARILEEYPFEAVLFPVSLFNVAYNYDFLSAVLPAARRRRMAVLGMKVFGAGCVRKAPSVEPYLRYALNQPIDTLVIGTENAAQLEQTVRIIKSGPPAMTEAEMRSALDEARNISQTFAEDEFDFVAHYREHGGSNQ